MFLFLNLLASVVVLGVIPAVAIFGLAERWDLWYVWAYAGVSISSVVFQTLVIYCQSPDLLKARMTGDGGNIRLRADRAFVVLSLLQYLITGLDQRFHWSDNVPLAGVVAGLVVVAIAWGLTTWAVSVNPFFSPAVRVQAERGHRVVGTGPYIFMRHPGYAGIALSMVASALALNSLLSIIPVVIYIAVTVHQTLTEDQMLRDELAGYAEYAMKVRYRLIPGVW